MSLQWLGTKTTTLSRDEGAKAQPTYFSALRKHPCLWTLQQCGQYRNRSSQTTRWSVIQSTRMQKRNIQVIVFFLSNKCGDNGSQWSLTSIGSVSFSFSVSRKYDRSNERKPGWTFHCRKGIICISCGVHICKTVRAFRNKHCSNNGWQTVEWVKCKFLLLRLILQLEWMCDGVFFNCVASHIQTGFRYIFMKQWNIRHRVLFLSETMTFNHFSLHTRLIYASVWLASC